MMLIERVRDVGSYARIVAAVLVLTTAIRFAIVSFNASGSPPPGAAGSASAQQESRDTGARSPPRTSAPPGEAIRVRMSVLKGPDRSDVFIDGSRRGQVPFLGDVSCRAGETVVIEIAPKKGEKLRFERPCGGGIIKID